MIKFNKENELVKYRFFEHLREAKGHSEKTVDCYRNALKRFETYTQKKSFKSFNSDQAIAYKKWIRKQNNTKGDPLGLGTIERDLRYLKGFIEWLSRENGYKSRVDYRDAEYLSLKTNELRAVKADRIKEYPTIPQAKFVIVQMPHNTDIEKRNRAILAFTLLTGCRVGAIGSLRLKHVNLDRGYVLQDSKEVKTKFGKSIQTYFLTAVGKEIFEIFTEWYNYLLFDKHFDLLAPLFPRTKVIQNSDMQFEAVGLEPVHWSGTNQIRDIFKQAFRAAKLKAYNPHSFRDTITEFALKTCQTPEELWAISQNFGHESIQVTLDNYGYTSPAQRGQIIQKLNDKTIYQN